MRSSRGQPEPQLCVCFVIWDLPLDFLNLGFTACKVGRSIAADTQRSQGLALIFLLVCLCIHNVQLYR